MAHSDIGVLSSESLRGKAIDPRQDAAGYCRSTSLHQPIVITGKRNTAVLVAEKDWAAIQETPFLLSVSGMRESVREGMEIPVEQCDEELDW